MMSHRNIVIIVVILAAAFGLLFIDSLRQEPAGQMDEVVKDSRQQEAILNSYEGQEGTGIATRVYAETMFIHTVTAKLPNPGPDLMYVAWLVKVVSGSDPLLMPVGVLSEQGNGAYGLVYQAQRNLLDYDQVIITKESTATGLDNNPEIRVLGGSF